MTQTLITIAIVILAIAYLAIKTYKKIKPTVSGKKKCDSDSCNC